MTDLNVALVLRATDLASPKVSALGSRLQSLGEMARRVSGGGGLGALAHSAGMLGQRLGGVASAAMQTASNLKIAFLGGGGIIGSVALAARQVVKTGAQFEAFSMQLEALEGSAEKGQKALAWATELAKQTSLTLPQVVESYARLRTFGIDPTNGSLQALIDTAAMQGKGFEAVEGMATAVGQAWTKTKLQAEEAMQLQERGVPVWDLLSKAVGRTIPELQQMAKDGELGRKEIALLMIEMGKRAEGASARFARSWDGMFSMLEDHLTNFLRLVSDAGFFTWAKDQLQGVLDIADRMAKDGSLDVWAKKISGDLKEVSKNALEFAKAFGGVMWDLGKAALGVRDLFGSWVPVIAALGAVIAGPLILSIAMLVPAIGSVSAALIAFAGTPVGAAVAGIGLIVAALGYYLTRQEEVDRAWSGWCQKLNDDWETASGRMHESLLRFVRSIVDAISSIADQIAGVFSGMAARVGAVFDGMAARVGSGIRSAGAALGIASKSAPRISGGPLPSIAQRALGGMTPIPAMTPARPAAAGQTSRSEVTVRFRDAPPGTRIESGRASPGTALDVDLGYSGVGQRGR